MLNKTIDLEDLYNWSAEAKPGDTLTYHIGFLAADRLVIEGGKEKIIEPYHSIAEYTYALWKNGGAHLYQIRMAPFQWAYIVERR